MAADCGTAPCRHLEALERQALALADARESLNDVSKLWPPSQLRRPFRTNSHLLRYQTLACLANFRCPSRAGRMCRGSRRMAAKNFG